MGEEEVLILLCGRDLDLLSSRKQMLHSMGCQVTTTLAPIRLFENLAAVRLLVLCHTLSKDELQEDLQTLADVCPDSRAVCVAPLISDPEAELPSRFRPKGGAELMQIVRRFLTT